MDKRYSQKAILLNYGLIIIMSFLAVVLGGVVYLLCRSRMPSFYHLIQFAGFEEQLISLRQNSIYLGTLLPNWMVYSLPNGLWAFAYAIIICSIWWGNTSKQKYFWLASIPALVFGFELLQLTGINEGTFCWQDMVSGLIGIAFGLLIGIKLIKSK